jgi:putative sterol carrier protein
MRDHSATFDTQLDECYTYPTKQEEKHTMETFVYLSPEWAEEAARRLRRDLTPERMKYLTSSMLTVYTNCPDGRKRAVYYRIEDGVVQEVSLQEGEPSRAEFTITGDYETFARISRAELKARSALMSGKLTLKGNLVKALRLAPVVDRLNEVLATIPADY